MEANKPLSRRGRRRLRKALKIMAEGMLTTPPPKALMEYVRKQLKAE